MSQSIALADLRDQLRQTEMAARQAVDEGGGFKAELNRLLEVAVRLTGEYRRIEKATHSTRNAAGRHRGWLEWHWTGDRRRTNSHVRYCTVPERRSVVECRLDP